MLLMSAGTSAAHPYLGNGRTPGGRSRKDDFLGGERDEDARFGLTGGGPFFHVTRDT